MGDAFGHLLGRRWRLERELGRGGSSVVYAARDTFDTGRTVAVKLAARDDAALVASMRSEFSLLYGIRHPHIVSTLAYGECDATVPGHPRAAPYLVQDIAPGTALADATDLDLPSVAMQLAAALAALHARGIRHGDLTPANVMVDAGHARLLDFGLARRGPSGRVAGTLRYMAPEAMAGAASTASDLYGLGAVLVHLATGAPPAGAHGGVLEGPIHPEIIAALTASEPDRRPSAERTFALFSELSGDTLGLRDLTLRSTRGHSKDLTEKISGQNGGVLTLSGTPGSGRSAALSDGVAHAVHLGICVIGGRVLRLEHGLASLERELGIDRTDAASEWARYEAIESRCTEGDRPAAVFIDDCDEALTPFLDFVERTDSPLLLVVVRDGGELHPPRLDAETARTLLSELRPLRPADGEAATALARASDGNVGALVDMLERYPGDALLAAAADQSLEPPAESLRLPSEFRRAAAVLGSFDDDVDSATLNEAFPELASATHGLAELGYLVPGSAPGTLRATRRLRRPVATQIRDDDLDRVGHFVALHAESLPATAGRLYAERGDTHAAAAALFTAAERARNRLEVEDALEHYTKLLELDPSHSGARVEKAQLLSSRGLHDEALASLNGEQPTVLEQLTRARILSAAALFAESAEAAPVGAADSKHRSEAEAIRARALMLAGRYEDASNTAHLSLGQRTDHPYRAELLDVLGMVAFYAGDIRRAQDHLEESVKVAPEGERQERARSHLGIVLHKAGALADAEDAYRAAIDGARARRDLPSQLLRQNNLATLLPERGRFLEALETYEEIASVARVLGDYRASVRARMNWANLEGWLGETEHARNRAGSALDDAEALEMSSEVVYLRLIVAEQLIALGDLEFAEDLLNLAQEGLDESSIAYSEAEVVRAQLAIRRQEHDRAFELSSAAYERVSGRGSLELIFGSWALLAAVAGDETLRRRAVKLGEQVQSLAESRDDPDYGWLVAASRAQLTDDSADAQRLAQLSGRLLSTARTRLSAHYERTYSTLWYRADLWQGTRSARVAAADDVTRDFDRLLAINRELARDHDPDRLLDRIIDAAIALSGAERGFIVLTADGDRDPDEDSLEVYAGRNLDRETLLGQELSRSIAARAIRSGGPVTTVDASGDERFREALSVHELKLRSVLCLPLNTNSGALGALYLDNRYRAHAFSDADVSLLSAFGDQAAIALANARMVSELRTKADELERSRAEVDELNQRLQRELTAQAEELRHAKRQSGRTGETGRYGMIGASESMRRIYTIVERVADKDVTVVIVGESGTGKELVARAIHDASARGNRPFVPVNCGAIPEQLLESELFGHERGAFTGAVRSKPGLFEVAQGGTLFLDEIGDMPMSMQVKLLRVLQQREFRRVGGTQALHSDARVISATHRDLAERVREGVFREDLWYRLNVVEVTVPPLRERREDLGLLIDHFFAAAGFDSDRVDRPARAAFLDYAWPGNVRELENEIQRAIALAGDHVELADLSEKLQRRGPRSLAGGDLKGQVEGFERALIQAALEDHGGKVASAARALGLTRAGLYKKLHKYSLGHVDKR